MFITGPHSMDNQNSFYHGPHSMEMTHKLVKVFRDQGFQTEMSAPLNVTYCFHQNLQHNKSQFCLVLSLNP